jgi:hypothetical protein
LKHQLAHHIKSVLEKGVFVKVRYQVSYYEA